MFVHGYAPFLGDKFRNEISSHTQVTKADSEYHPHSVNVFMKSHTGIKKCLCMACLGTRGTSVDIHTVQFMDFNVNAGCSTVSIYTCYLP
jgi:hypothetical protein